MPGDYRVRLTVDGARLEQPFKVLRDPRLTDVTAAQLAAQFEFSKATHARLNDATSAVARIRDMKLQIADRLKQTSDAAIGAAARAVAAKLGAVESDVYEVRVAAESDIKHFGPKLTNKLANVYAVAQGADAPPTKQAQTVFGELSTKLAVQLDRLGQITKSDLMKLNDLLRKANLAPIATHTPG